MCKSLEMKKLEIDKVVTPIEPITYLKDRELADLGGGQKGTVGGGHTAAEKFLPNGSGVCIG